MIKDIAIYAVAVLAACRLNRLIVHDTITVPLREWLKAKSKENRVARFYSAASVCYWCTGVWTASATSAIAHWSAGWTWTLYPLTLLSAAWLAQILAQWLEG